MNAPARIAAVDAFVDPRLTFLCCASARYLLVESGEMGLDEAFTGLLDQFDDLLGANWSWHWWDACRRADARAAVELRRASRIRPSPRPTPQTTIDAVMLAVRERGIGALREPANVERLRRCDAAAKAQLRARIEKLTGLKHER